MHLLIGFSLIGFSLVVSALLRAEEAPDFVLKARIELADVRGRLDHLSADVRGHRLFVAALGNHTVEVLNVRSERRERTITGLAEPQGVLFEPAASHLFVACGGDGATKIFDGSTYQLLETVRFSGNADNIRCDERRKRVIVGYGYGALGILDFNGRKAGEIRLDAHPESFQLEQTGTRAFVNIPERKEIQVVDLAQGKTTARWPVRAALQNFPMALDEQHHRLLAGCREPARLLAIDTETGKVTASAAIVGDTDDIFFDATKRRVYVIGGAGFVDVLEQHEPDRYIRVAHLATGAGARTGLMVAEWHNLFIAVPRRGAQPAEILVYSIR